MQINIQGHGLEISAPLKDYAAKKIGKIEEFYENIQKVDITLDARAIANLDRSHVAEVNMWVAGLKVIRASAGGKDMYAAIDLVFEEIERQVKKHKDKHVKEARRKAKKLKKELRSFGSLPEIIEPELALVKVKRFARKPMDEEEAQAELKILAQEFLLFRNANAENICLVYKTDGGYKVLDPAKSKVKSMYTEVAIKKLKESKENYLPFINSKSKELNVLYKRPTGSFGLVEPDV